MRRRAGSPRDLVATGSPGVPFAETNLVPVVPHVDQDLGFLVAPPHELIPSEVRRSGLHAGWSTCQLARRCARRAGSPRGTYSSQVVLECLRGNKPGTGRPPWYRSSPVEGLRLSDRHWI